MEGEGGGADMDMDHRDGGEEGGASGARIRRAYIYAVAGRNRGETLGTSERLCLATNEWERCPMLQDPRGSHGAAALDGTVYAIAGGGMKCNLSTCEAFDDKGPWRHVAPVGEARHALAAAASTSCIYAVGGWAHGEVTTKVCESFDPKIGVWKRCADPTHGRRLHGAAVVNERLYVFGGASEDKPTISSAECYEPQTDMWHPCKQMPAACYTSVASVGNFVYVFLWGRYLSRYCPSQDSYTKLCELPIKEWFGFAVAALEKSIYCIGGVSCGKWKGWVYRYDTEDNTWHELPRMQAVRRRCAATACIHEGPPPQAPPQEQVEQHATGTPVPVVETFDLPDQG